MFCPPTSRFQAGGSSSTSFTLLTGTRGRLRSCGLSVRSGVLCPAELREYWQSHRATSPNFLLERQGSLHLDDGSILAPEAGFDPASTVVNSHPSLPFDYSGILVDRRGTAPRSIRVQTERAAFCVARELVP